MQLNEKIIEVIYNIIIQQNKYLIKVISQREKIPLIELKDLFLKQPRKRFKEFISHHPLPDN
jgi:hypothetical protein